MAQRNIANLLGTEVQKKLIEEGNIFNEQDTAL